jgi:hypothetical protein
MKPRLLASLAIALLALAAISCNALAQSAPKTANIVQEVGPDGSVSLSVELSFDAAAWRQWKSQVGDDPSRLRGVMKHQFSAYVIDDFKFEKDDLNRTAKMTLRSPAGAELRKDGHFRLPVDKEYRLVNNNGREWFFSGNNPYANNSLQTIRITLPTNAHEVTLTGAGGAEQGLIYSLKVPAGKSRVYLVLGAVLAGIGALALAAGFLLKQPAKTSPAHASARTAPVEGG